MDASQICFGLSRDLDEQSLKSFLKKMADDSLLDVLVPRLDDEEIDRIVSVLSGVLRQHLREREYHRLFLGAGAGK